MAATPESIEVKFTASAEEAVRNIKALAGHLFTLRLLQTEHAEWARRNFGEGRPGVWSLLGLMEELGELAHAHLKGEQAIRHTPEEIDAMKRDAVGDLVVFLADYCTREEIDFQQAVYETWQQVKTRDWKADAKGGVTATKAIQGRQDELVHEIIGAGIVLVASSNGQFVGTCPFCQAPTGFRVTPQTQTWHCYTCDLGGDVTSFQECMADRVS